MPHYICTGECHGESQKPGICQTKDCSKFGEPLEECHCDDGWHKDYGESENLENLDLKESEDEM